MKDSRVI